MVKKAASREQTPLGLLGEARTAREIAERREREAVAAARAAGISWAAIGALYGLTKQGAQQRFKASAATE